MRNPVTIAAKDFGRSNYPRTNPTQDPRQSAGVFLCLDFITVRLEFFRWRNFLSGIDLLEGKSQEMLTPGEESLYAEDHI